MHAHCAIIKQIDLNSNDIFAIMPNIAIISPIEGKYCGQRLAVELSLVSILSCSIALAYWALSVIFRFHI